MVGGKKKEKKRNDIYGLTRFNCRNRLTYGTNLHMLIMFRLLALMSNNNNKQLLILCLLVLKHLNLMLLYRLVYNKIISLS